MKSRRKNCYGNTYLIFHYSQWTKLSKFFTPYIEETCQCLSLIKLISTLTLSVCVAALHVAVSQTVEAGAECALSFMLTYLTICSWSICTVRSLSSNCPCKNKICRFKSANSSRVLGVVRESESPPLPPPPPAAAPAATCEFRPLKNPFFRLGWLSNGLWVSD